MAWEILMRKFCNSMLMRVNNEDGFTLILALILLMLLTIIGVTAINTSTTGTMLTTTEEVKRSTFNAAESGVEHATAMLQSLFLAKNQIKLQQALTSGSTFIPVWTFALDGSTRTAASSLPGAGSQWLERFNAGALWIENAPMGNGYTYTVRVWNNAEPNADPTPAIKDTDGIIVVGAVATGPNKAIAAAEAVLCGSITNLSSTAAYTAQAGAGAGKNYNASDVNAISTVNLGSLSNNANLK